MRGVGPGEWSSGTSDKYKKGHQFSQKRLGELSTTFKGSTGRPRTEETFHAATRTTYDGRALAIVRPTGVGEITVTVTAEGLEQATVVIRASAAI